MKNISKNSTNKATVFMKTNKVIYLLIAIVLLSTLILGCAEQHIMVPISEADHPVATVNEGLYINIVIIAALVLIFILTVAYLKGRKKQKVIQKLFTEIDVTHDRTQIMLDASPLSTLIWDRDLNMIDCNEAALNLYKLNDKLEFAELFFTECSPEYQPDGQISAKKAAAYIMKAFEDGHLIFDWMHKIPGENTLIPTEVTLVRTKYSQNDVVVAYTRDMREYHKTLKMIDEITMELVSYDIDHFEDTLQSVMGIAGEIAKADRVSIWENHIENGELYSTRIYEWFRDTKLQQGNKQSVSVAMPEDWYKRLSKNECINGVIRELPEAQRKLLQNRGIVSLIIVPIFLGDIFWGLLGFDDHRNERVFSMQEESILRTVSFMLANSILRNEMTQQLTEAKEDALYASNSKSTFLANMSHEIRTPMNTILGITEIILAKEPQKEIVEDLLKIHSSCMLLLDIINDILDFSKIEAGKLDITLMQYDVASLLNDIININIIHIKDKTVEFELEIDDNIPAKLIGDELRIKQVLNNLLTNAFKYTNSGKVTMSVKCRQCHSNDLCKICENCQPKDRVVLEVSIRDTGCGIDESQMSKLFDEYMRFAQEIDGVVIEGTGLGLAITQRLVKLMDAEMYVESELGKGSLFTLCLPQKTINGEVLNEEVMSGLRGLGVGYMVKDRTHKIKRNLMPYGKILIVDDVETNLYVATGLAHLYELQIDTAMGGREAVEKAKNNSGYDIIFMDHMMPGMDGIEATRELRNSGYKGAIVALTANALAGNAEMFMRNGFDDFIAKPIDLRRLDAVLNKYVRKKQPPAKQPPKVLQTQPKVQPSKTSPRPQISRRLIDAFIRDAYRISSELKELYQKDALKNEDDLRRFTTFVHGLRGALLNIGEKSLAQTAYKLEEAGKEHDVALIMKDIPGFLNELRAFLKELEK